MCYRPPQAEIEAAEAAGPRDQGVPFLWGKPAGNGEDVFRMRSEVSPYEAE